MQFLAPWMLLGGAAVSVPIILHFFFKARHKPLPWAAMDFLKEAIEQTSRRLKFQEWVLLALRCLVLILLALAIARPARDSARTGGRGDAVDAVLVFDVSYSMGARDGDKTRIERAKEAALAVLDTLPQNSTVQIYAADDREQPVLLGPVSRTNIDQARQLIPAVELSGRATDFLPGLREALAAAESGTSPMKEVYVFTDLQKSGFDRNPGSIRSKCEEIRGRANLIFVRCGNPERTVANVAVAAVQLIGDIPHTRSTVPFVVSVKNTGAVAVSGVTVGLSVTGSEPAVPKKEEPKAAKKPKDKDAAEDEDRGSTQQVDLIQPGQVVPVTLYAALGDTAGPRVLTVRLTGDQLPGDNEFHQFVLVRDAVRVLIVDGLPNSENPAESASHYVRVALNPSQDPNYFIQSDVVTAASASPGALIGKDICYLANVPAADLNPRFVERLREFVDAGGGLVIGCGDQVKPGDYNTILGAGGAKLLPFPVGDVQATSEALPFLLDQESVAANSALARFRESEFRGALTVSEVFKLVKLDTGGPPGGRVLLSTIDRKPVIAAREVGAGEVIFVATSLDETWAKLRDKMFVPFTRFVVHHLTGKKVAGGTLTAGEPAVRHPQDVGKVYELVQPLRPGESSPRRVKLGQPAADSPGERPKVTATDTALPGVYRIAGEDEPEAQAPLYVMNPDPRESADLAVISDGDLGQLLGFTPSVIQAGAGTEAAVTTQRTRGEWTEWVLLALFVFLLAEGVWAWLCGKAW
jgi:hypothetical protein